MGSGYGRFVVVLVKEFQQLLERPSFCREDYDSLTFDFLHVDGQAELLSSSRDLRERLPLQNLAVCYEANLSPHPGVRVPCKARFVGEVNPRSLRKGA